jgi:hypothetical protein
MILSFGMAAAMLVSGCSTPAQNATLVIGGVTLAGAQVPTDEIEQIYYLGVFDPLEQLPPTIYRVTVRGQASFLSGSDFASGWVPAPLIDSLSATLKKTKDGSDTRFSFEEGTGIPEVRMNPGRRLVMFGPEGFREAPRDHRLVLVMGADPAAFFEAVDLALGDMSQVTVERGNTAIRDEMLRAHQQSAESIQQLDTALTSARSQLQPANQ